EPHTLALPFIAADGLTAGDYRLAVNERLAQRIEKFERERRWRPFHPDLHVFAFPHITDQGDAHRTKIRSSRRRPLARFTKLQIEADVDTFALDGLLKKHRVHLPFAGLRSILACLIMTSVVDPHLADALPRQGSNPR